MRGRHKNMEDPEYMADMIWAAEMFLKHNGDMTITAICNEFPRLSRCHIDQAITRAVHEKGIMERKENEAIDNLIRNHFGVCLHSEAQ